MKRVVVCLVRNNKNELLFGLRNDNLKWTNPGGHIEEGEDAYIACVRELKEETGLDAIGIQLLKARFIKDKKILVYVFEVEINRDQEIDTSQDPDQECEEWMFLNPSIIEDELHVKRPHNVLLDVWDELSSIITIRL